MNKIRVAVLCLLLLAILTGTAGAQVNPVGRPGQEQLSGGSINAYHYITQYQFFDKCNIGTTAQMQTWWTYSPYWENNIYIGGSARGCANTGLNSSWVSTVSAQGWNFVPTWVGPQAPCSSFGSRFSSDPATAYNQGRTEAGSAATAASNLGLAGTIIYYDMEAYPSSCRTAVSSFISGWSGRLRELGYRAGAYGAGCGSYVSDWANVANVPDDVWLAHWIYSTYTAGASVWGVACTSDTLWVNHQRLRQYAGGHNETYGSITFNIDSNASDGHVAGNNSRGLGTLAGSIEGANPSGVRESQLVSANQGWVTVRDRLLWTKDGGKQWTNITPATPFQAIVRNGFFLNANQGWFVVGTPADAGGRSQLSVARTSNGGESWQSTPLPFNPDNPSSTQSPVYVTFTDAQNGWVSIKLATSSNFSLGTLFRTTDGGKSWTQVALPIGGPVRFVNAQFGWTAGGAAGDELYVTRDGGQTWTRQSVVSPKSESTQVWYGMPTFENAQVGVLPVTVVDPRQAHLEFYVTRDGGQSWRLATTAPIKGDVVPGAPIPVQVLDASHWLVADSSVIVQAGSQAGRTIRTLNLPAGVVDVEFVTADAGWARVVSGTCSGRKVAGGSFQCQSRSAFVKTTDGGATWTEMNP